MKPRALLIAASALALASCANSGNSANLARAVPPMPALVLVEAGRGVTPLPRADVKAQHAQGVVKALRQSELDKQRALLAAIRHYERARALLRKGDAK